MLQNLQIRSKLAALLILPLVALTVFASTQVVTAVRNSADAGRVNAVSHFSEDLVNLADALQRERALTMGFVASQRTANYGTMISDRVLVNEQRQTFEAISPRLTWTGTASASVKISARRGACSRICSTSSGPGSRTTPSRSTP
jgi:hypothetical protein